MHVSRVLLQLHENQIILLDLRHQAAQIKIARYPRFSRVEQRPPRCTTHWDRTLQAASVVAADIHFAASQSSNESVGQLYKELVVAGEDQWKSNFAEMGVGTVRREF